MNTLDQLPKAIFAQQFNLKSKTNYLYYCMVIIVLVGSGVHYYKTGTFQPYYLIPAAYVLVDYVFFNLIEIDKYIKNRFTFQSSVIAIFTFLLYLGLNLFDILSDIKNGNYQSQYVVSFEKGYEEYSDHKFFMANSKYAFLLDNDTQEITVIPITGIKSMQTKKSR